MTHPAPYRGLSRRIAALLAFMCLPVSLAAILCVVLTSKKSHAYALLNNTGRQRTRVERYANSINHTLASILLNDWEGAIESKQRAHEVASEYEAIHNALRYGHTIDCPTLPPNLNIPPATDEKIIASLDAAELEWTRMREAAAQALLADTDHLRTDDGFQSLQAQTQNTIEAVDRTALTIQHLGETHMASLRDVISLAVACTFSFLLGTFHLMRTRIVRPFEATELARQKSVRQLKRQTEKARKLAARAEAANVAKSTFLTNMSHEIRTPLTAILGFVDTLADGIRKPENRDAIETIKRNGDHLLNLVNDILDLSKIDAGKMTIEPQPTDTLDILSQVTALEKKDAEQHGIAFECHFETAIPRTIVTDPMRLRQILFNIIGNAIKFTHDGAVVLTTRVNTSGDVPTIEFDIRDTGIGMSDEQIAKLFRPFTQADETLTRRFGGTGMGLVLSKRFAELLGGDVRIVESRPGVGTLIRVSIATGPLDDVEMVSRPATTNNHAHAPNTEKVVSIEGIRILLAEDGHDNQRLISHILKKAGAFVTVCDNGKLGMEAALEARESGEPFDVILMDMQMPVMDGYEAAGQLRKANYDGPIIALTAHAMSGDRQKCLDAGCDAYATKPVNRQQLTKTIAEQLNASAPPA